MVKRFFIPRFALGVIAAFTISFFTANASYAEDSAATGLQISPATVNLSGEPGKSYTVNIKVTNVTTSTLTFTTSINDFGAKDETGTPSILLDPTKNLPTSIQKWVEPTSSFTLTPQQEQKLNVTINVPLSAEPGGHYGVIRFAGQPASADASSVGQIASAGTLVLVKISGDSIEKLELPTFSITTEKDVEGDFFEAGPLKIVERFKNTGNVHVQPVGQVEIRDTFGNHVQTVTVNDTKGNVLPGSIRRFEQDFNKPWLFGHYSANISIAYGTHGDAIVRTISFWVIPYKLVLLAVLIVITVIYILVQLVKRYNKYIINRAKQHEKANKKSKK